MAFRHVVAWVTSILPQVIQPARLEQRGPFLRQTAFFAEKTLVCMAVRSQAADLYVFRGGNTVLKDSPAQTLACKPPVPGVVWLPHSGQCPSRPGIGFRLACSMQFSMLIHQSKLISMWFGLRWPLVCSLVVCAGLSGCKKSAPGIPLDEIRPLGDDNEIGQYHDFCEPLEQPVWKPAANSEFMRPDDPVIGILTKQGAYALPWWVLKNHHVANFDVDGEEILVTLCEMCSSASAFDPRVDGERLHYRVVGIYNGTHIIRDEETQTFWLPFLGRGQKGPHMGKQLKRRRVDQANWADWLQMHPQTQVAYGEPSAREGHGSKHFPGATLMGDGMLASLQHRSLRLSQNDLVLGIVVNDEHRAFPMAELTQNGAVLQEVLGELPIVVFHKPHTFLAAAFSRQHQDEMLDFTTNEKGEIVDRQTGSTWNYAGIALEGPLSGTELEPVTYSMDEWYMWFTQHPQTTLYAH